MHYKNLDSQTATTIRRCNRAIVIGASMSGLLAARVLSERFSQVLVLERDELPNGPAMRKGTPQVGHAHALLSRGRQIMEELFPGFTKTLCARGGRLGDAGLNVQVLVGGRELARAATGEEGVVCSRLLIEDEVRSRVRALPNVQILTKVDVVEPILDTTRGCVNGVRIRVRDENVESVSAQTTAAGALAADLVVDCTGRGSRAPQWLAQWGYMPPEDERVTIGVGYATAYFERKHDQFPSINAVISQASPDMLCPAVMIAQEPEPGTITPRWVVTFGGFSGDHPEPTLEGLKQRSLRSGSHTITRVVHESTLLSPVTRYGFPHSQRRHYEKLAEFPDRFLVMGDAICSFNPIYGQGMTVAACEALALRDVIAKGVLEGMDRLSGPFFKAASKVIDNPWQIAVGADLAIPTVQGERPFMKRAINAYMRALFRAAEHDAHAAIAFRNVVHMLHPPASLFMPNTLARVAWQSFLHPQALRSSPVAT